MAKKKSVKEKITQLTASKAPVDYPFLIIVLLLLIIGLVMVFSSSYASAYYENLPSTYYFTRQATFAVIGLIAMYVASHWDYRKWRPMSPMILIVSIVLLVLVLFIGVGNFGEKRWINLGFATFQPSEIAKFAVIVFFSSMISVYSDKMRTFRYGVLPFAIILGVIAFLMFKEPHLSGAVLILGVGGVLMFIGGTNWLWLGGSMGAVGVAGYVAISLLGYAQDRLAVWFDPFIDPLGKGYQSVQALYAMGSGGLLGLGFGNSRQKFLYLPEAHNDFIFAIICEELGFIGAIIVIFLFVMLIVRGYWIALHARDKFGSLMAAGITTMIALQTALNLAVVTGVLPVTGAALPFFSYGGTALMMLLGEMGIVLNISRSIPAPKAG